MRHPFHFSFICCVIGLIIAYLWGGLTATAIASMLCIMEISLSFDNAIMNAAVLKTMNRKWQLRFLTWGIFIAVFGVRFLFPLLIVAVVAQLGLWEVSVLAFTKPDEYSRHLIESNISISAFGGMFLLLVFLSFLFNDHRDIHWLGKIERKLSQIGKLDAIEIIVASTILLIAVGFVPEVKQFQALASGIVGIILFTVITGLSHLLGNKQNSRLIQRSSAMSFLYLEVLDASFSFDGAVGAFAITKDVVIILIGLTIGALFVRSITLFLVQKRTLERYLYLEHGAHYAIGALAFIMLLSMRVHVPEILTGLIGVVFIGLALFSSIKHKG